MPAVPVTVPITVQGGPGTALGTRPMVEVKVGRSRRVPILLDTGSVGLRIFAPVVRTGRGSGVTVTDRPTSITYSGGSHLTGRVAQARIRLGPQPTATRIPFALVDHASCTAAKPTCPTAGGIEAAMRAGEYGVLGVGMNTTPSGVPSPVLGMRGALGRRWSIHVGPRRGRLVLGARPPTGPAVTRIHLAPQAAAVGGPFWRDQRVPLCVGVGALRACVPGIFDTGTFQLQVSGSPLNTAPTLPGTSRVVAGLPVTVALPGGAAPFWRFTTGQTKSVDTVLVRTPGAPFVNTGVQAFAAFTVAFDQRAGTIRLRRP